MTSPVPPLAPQTFLLEKIARGAPLPGTYPPNETTLAEYEARKRSAT